jgi:hypothetical protein
MDRWQVREDDAVSRFDLCLSPEEVRSHVFRDEYNSQELLVETHAGGTRNVEVREMNDFIKIEFEPFLFHDSEILNTIYRRRLYDQRGIL